MPDETPLEIVTGDALSAMERSQIDVQISTAKKFPRSIGKFMKEAETMIALNQETAEGCNYKLKRRNADGSFKFIEGPSIRLMEIAACAWTNLSFGSRIVGIDQDWVTSQGVAFDMERNNRIFVEVKRSIKGKSGRFSNDMIMVTCNAAGSIARRNALLGGAIPRAYINQLAEFAKKQAMGDAKSLPERLQRAFEYFTVTLGVDKEKVLAYLEKPTMADCTLADLEVLQGLKTAIKEGDTTIDAEFEQDKPKDATPNLGGTPPTNVTALPTQPATTTPATTTPTPAATTEAKTTTPTPTTTPAPAKRTPKKKEEPPAPAAPAPTPPTPPAPTPPAPTPPAAAAAPTPPTPEPAAAATPAPQFSPEELGQMVADKLQERGVSVDQFFDWLGSTGRDHKYKFALDTVGSITELPLKCLQDMVANGYESLAPCIKIFGTKQ